MTISKTYDNALDVLKQSFSGSECELWVDEVRNHFIPQPLRILDIGIGTGESIQKRLLQLSWNGYSADLHGLDPNLCVETVTRHVYDDAHLYKTRFEEATFSQTFDVVNASQSIYYMQNIPAMLRKMTQLVQPGGMVTITLWSQHCSLYQLQRTVFGAGATLVTAEQVAEQLVQQHLLRDVKLVSCKGQLNLSRLRASEQGLDAILTIISRKFGDVFLIPQYRAKLEKALLSLPDVAPRINYMLVGQK
ncbi:class I SAM-dependent methyltransferase [Tengunoibacter tsumagoiensis]|uniref:Methyltransferase domain-containing protein n=1 Tax=Tengunoibacter tsumagoiensis TaxID=2014871 RepID=A0A402A774_9CHLR|nr:methyltransferase domain-containing protein [Tengunoibacter tsumagoiensis]GCE14948.1 hypothetical protein KTT_48070 [Tengunoibacter tsumagoiensis]